MLKLAGSLAGKEEAQTKPQVLASGDILSVKDTKKNLTASKSEDSSAANDPVYPPFEFPSVSPPSIITEGSQGGPWRKKITEFTGSEDEKDFPHVVPGRCLEQSSSTSRKYKVVTLGKLSAPRILRVHKVTNYVVEKMVLDSPLDSLPLDGGPQPLFAGNGLLPSGSKPWQKLKPSIEILCNNQGGYS
ncbi:Transducin/WD40 repeat-like superfamily protein [Raphanus sativus]|nr:Transducin/WD40 repeat-like superfamily protein [Raphanus sativus]